MTNNYKLYINNLDQLSEIASYKELLSNHWDNNIYCAIEHLNYFKTNSGKIKYFTFEKNGNIIVLMSFILRKVENIIEKEYYDVVSPYGYSGPIFSEEADDRDIAEFWKHVDRWYAQNNVISEFIRFSLTNNHQNYSGKLIDTLFNVKGKLLNSFEEQWKSFLPKVRNNYRRAENNNLTFKIFHNNNITEETISIFEDIYTNTMKRNNASSIYFFSKKYFKDLIFSNLNNFSIAIVYFEGTPISTELIININKTIYAYLGGTDSNYFSYRPNDFLRVNIIKWAIERKLDYYILGGGMKNSDGLYKSKKAFFPKDEDIRFYTGRKIINQEIYNQLCLQIDSDYQNFTENDLDQKFFPYYRANG